MKTLVLAWIVASVGGGGALAALTKRIHQSLSFKKNWLYFTFLLAIAMAAFYAIAVR